MRVRVRARVRVRVRGAHLARGAGEREVAAAVGDVALLAEGPRRPLAAAEILGHIVLELGCSLGTRDLQRGAIGLQRG